ncbi:hypothetical protein [Thiolapillus sp.]|nr:hypothetical protein [Thiolapillus sp.]
MPYCADNRLQEQSIVELFDQMTRGILKLLSGDLDVSELEIDSGQEAA